MFWQNEMIPRQFTFCYTIIVLTLFSHQVFLIIVFFFCNKFLHMRGKKFRGICSYWRFLGKTLSLSSFFVLSIPTLTLPQTYNFNNTLSKKKWLGTCCFWNIGDTYPNNTFRGKISFRRFGFYVLVITERKFKCDWVLPHVLKPSWKFVNTLVMVLYVSRSEKFRIKVVGRTFLIILHTKTKK